MKNSLFVIIRLRLMQ